MHPTLYHFGAERLHDPNWMEKEAFLVPAAKAAVGAAKSVGKTMGFGGALTAAFVAPGAVGAAQRIGNAAAKPAGSIRPNLHSPVVNSSPMGSMF